MLFHKKGNLRREYDQKLLALLEELKIDWARQKHILDQSVETSEDVMYYVHLSEAKYFYMLKQAKNRKLNMMMYAK
ncbi:YaaL family protein [Ectobacillus polymachus]|uniref:YaaL family protein n=1 Tax=Ectobacillus polymachus TaxID=1508806 RepID=UPI003A8BE809